MNLGPLQLNTIHTGDAKELARGVPDGSIDLIFTDPVYDRRDDYLWLAETARRVLKPAGAVLCWSNGNWHRRNANWMEAAGLTYRWDFAVAKSGVSSVGFCGKVVAAANRLLWMDVGGGSKMLAHLKDGYISVPAPRLNGGHRWTKDPIFTAKAINAFSAAGAIILDPFAGGGTVPAICKAMGRDFLAFEIEPEAAEQGRQRLELTMPLLAAEAQEVLPLTA
jgi:hypothetical protein